MSEFINAVRNFVGGLLDAIVPGINISFGSLILGLWAFFLIGRAVVGFLWQDMFGGDD